MTNTTVACVAYSTFISWAFVAVCRKAAFTVTIMCLQIVQAYCVFANGGQPICLFVLHFQLWDHLANNSSY